MSTSRVFADVQTGEEHIVSKEQREPYGYPRNDEGTRFMTVGAVAFTLIKKAGYNASTLCVLLHLIETAGPGGVVVQTQQEIADVLETTRESVCRAMSRLLKDGHLYRDGKVVVLNPNTAFTGSGAEHRRAVRRMESRITPRRHLRRVA